MDNLLINNQFQSILYVIIHFSCSLIQLTCTLVILGLQITLTITQTCAFRIGVGFWSFPFLLSAPISIWILLWKRNSLSCVLTFIIHVYSTLFVTAVIIISFIALIQQIGSPCSTSSISNNYFLPINISLIAISIVFKLFLYGEMFLLHILQRHTNGSSILTDKNFHEKNTQIISNDDVNIKPWSPFRSIINKNRNNITDLDI
jgi:hypothetical protein